VVGTSNHWSHPTPIREVEVEEQHYQWQTDRYDSGMQSYTSERVTLDMLARDFRWTLDKLDAPELPRMGHCKYCADKAVLNDEGLCSICFEVFSDE
jgi:hypothetical protein